MEKKYIVGIIIFSLAVLVFYIVNISATEWDISTAVNTNNLSIIGQDINPQGVFINSSGTGMYLVGSTGDKVYQYYLSTPWDISTAVNTQNESILGQDTNMFDIFINSSGNGMYLIGSTAPPKIFQYYLSTPWDITTAVNTDNLSIAAGLGAIFINSSGTGMYSAGTITAGSGTVLRYQMTTPWLITSATNTQNLTTTAGGLNGLFVNSSGTGMYLVGQLNDNVQQYYLSTPWDLSTATNTVNLSIIGQDTTMRGIFINSSGIGMYLVGATGGKVYQYNMAPTPTNCWTNDTTNKLLIIPNGCVFQGSLGV